MNIAVVDDEETDRGGTLSRCQAVPEVFLSAFLEGMDRTCRHWKIYSGAWSCMYLNSECMAARRWFRVFMLLKYEILYDKACKEEEPSLQALAIGSYNVKPTFLWAGQGQSRHWPLPCPAFPVRRSVAASAR